METKENNNNNNSIKREGGREKKKTEIHEFQMKLFRLFACVKKCSDFFPPMGQ